MRILHTADWHVGRTLRNRSRAQEHRDVLREIAGIARQEKADLILVAGDLFDSAAPSAESEEIVYEALLDLAQTGAPVLAIAGNHDHPQRLQAVAPLLHRARVRVAPVVARPDSGGIVDVETNSGEKARVAMIPFLSQRHALAAAQLMGQEAFEHVQEYAEHCGHIIDTLCRALTGPHVNLAVAHLHISGGKLGGGERMAHTVLDYYIPPHKFPGTLHYVALGHLHAPQQIGAGSPMWYSGAPIQLDFGEAEVKNSVLIIDAKPGTPAEITPFPLASGKPLKNLRGTLESLRPLADSVKDAYLKLTLDEPHRVGLADEARHIFPNAVEVNVAPQTAERKPDAIDVDKAQPRDLFAAYLSERSVRDPQLIDAFDRLMEQAHEAA